MKRAIVISFFIILSSLVYGQDISKQNSQKKKLEKEKKALEDKQDALEKKRKEQQYHRDMLQAVVNGAMAVTYAAANKWPIPAIPMMALAAADWYNGSK